MRVLLTGSSGWLGRFLAPRLRAVGHQVVGLDVAPGADTQVFASVADRAAIDRVFGEHAIQAVVHAGALHKPDIKRSPSTAFVDVNVIGTGRRSTSDSSGGCRRVSGASMTPAELNGCWVSDSGPILAGC